MKNLIKKVTFLAITFLISSNISAQVNSDYDKSTDFSVYKTVSFGGWAKDSDKQLNTFDKQRILDAFTNEFNSRGIKVVPSDGDATVTLYLVVKTQSNVTAYTNFNGGLGYMGGWGYSRGFGGMGMGTATTTLSQQDYQVGTLIVDYYDTASKKLVWQGDMSSDVETKSEKRDKTIPKKIGKLMKAFPVAPIKN